MSFVVGLSMIDLCHKLEKIIKQQSTVLSRGPKIQLKFRVRVSINCICYFGSNKILSYHIPKFLQAFDCDYFRPDGFTIKICFSITHQLRSQSFGSIFFYLTYSISQATTDPELLIQSEFRLISGRFKGIILEGWKKRMISPMDDCL